MKPVLRLESLCFAWPDSPPVVQIDELELMPGEHLFIQGPSGSGKSTLLNLITGLQPGYTGSLEVAGQNLARLSSRALDRLRADHIGLLFQQFNLLPYLNLIDNVCLPCSLSRQRRRVAGQHRRSIEQEANADHCRRPHLSAGSGQPRPLHAPAVRGAGAKRQHPADGQP